MVGALVILEITVANLELHGRSGRAAHTAIEPFPQSNPFLGAPDREVRSWPAQERDIIGKQKQPERNHPNPKDWNHRRKKTTQHDQHTEREPDPAGIGMTQVANLSRHASWHFALQMQERLPELGLAALSHLTPRTEPFR